MSQQYIRTILSEDDLSVIHSLLPKLEWEDGLASLKGGEEELRKDLKRDIQQAVPSSYTKAITQIIIDSLNSDIRFLNHTMAKHTEEPFIVRMPAGSWYKPHQDNYDNGHYSTTIFLSEPDTYEGGELHLIDSSLEVYHKLPAGDGVTYSTGTTHEVKEVTEGERIAAVFWTDSLIKDNNIRAILTDLRNAQGMLEEKIFDDIKDAEQDPRFLLHKAVNQMMRIYSV